MVRGVRKGGIDKNTSPPDQVTTPPSLPPPGTRSQHLPPGPGHNTSPHLDQVTTSPPPDQVTTPPRTRSQHLPLGLGHNTSLPPQNQVTTPPPLQNQVTTPPPSLPRDYAQAGSTHPTGMHSCFKIADAINIYICTHVICYV